ncbi:endoplasmic reticulum-based factor for assembly of V-ATPase-domain-containing protein [Dipodascopsis tothii]|uniref:endoplasmic reticulum-based factor for assembly of V-ATPase-domain-containing protein n=1 Tax=Dipodascopsis tothii TaxID=44089 RepID=UPI0034CFE382
MGKRGSAPQPARWARAAVGCGLAVSGCSLLRASCGSGGDELARGGRTAVTGPVTGSGLCPDSLRRDLSTDWHRPQRPAMKLVCTDHIREAARVYEDRTGTAVPLGPAVSHRMLAKLAVELQAVDEKFTLAALVRGTEVYVPPKPVKEKNPEYEAHMQRLRVQLAEKEYQAMIASAVPELSASFLEPFDKKELKNQISVIINVLFSVASVAFAAWTWATSLNTGARLLLALSSALVVLVAEVALYMGYLQRQEEAKREERLRPEVKEVVATTELRAVRA